jgi:hypothetical protein
MTMGEVVRIMGPWVTHKSGYTPASSLETQMEVYVWEKGDLVAVVLTEASSDKVWQKDLVRREGWLQRLRDRLGW